MPEIINPPAAAQATPTPAATTPETAAAATPKPDNRTRSQQTADFLRRIVEPKPKKEEPPKVEEKPAATPDKPAAKVDPAPKAAKVRDNKGKFQKPAQAVQPPAPQIDVEKIARETAKGTAEAMMEHERSKAPAPAPLAPEVEHTIRVLTKMGELNPAKKGLAAQYTKFQRDEEAYATHWENENPGKTFNGNDEEHNAFYSRQPDFQNDPDFRRAEIRIEAEALTNEQSKAIKELRETIDQKDRRQTAEREVALARHNTVRQVAELAEDPEVKALFTEEGHFVGKEMTKLRTEDPEKFHLVNGTFNELSKLTEIAHLVFNNVESFDPKNQAHQFLQHELTKAEHALATEIREGVNEGLDGNGRPFLPMQQYFELPPAQRQNYWTTTQEMVTTYAARERAEKIQQFNTEREENFNRLAAKRGYVKNGSPPADKVEPAKTATPTAPERAKVVSPSASVDAIPGTNGLAKKNGPLSGLELAMASIRNRK